LKIVSARLIGAELTRVEHHELCEIAEPQGPEQTQAAVFLSHLRKQRHRFFVHLIGIGAPFEERGRGLRVFRKRSRIVVVDLVVVPRDDERK
jgi:hypothetical protein